MKKFIILLFLVSPLLVFGYNNNILRSPEKNKKIHIKTITVGTGDIVSKVKGRGIIESSNGKNFWLKNNQKIKNILINIGDKVDKGQVLAILEDDSFNLKLNEAETEKLRLEIVLKELNRGDKSKEIKDAKRQVEITLIDFNRAKREMELSEELFNVKAIAFRQYEESKTHFRKAKFQYDGAVETIAMLKEKQKSDKKIARLHYKKAKMTYNQLIKEKDNFSVKAPFNGQIIAVNRDNYNIESKKSFLTLVDPTKLKVTTWINTFDIPLVKKGQKVEVFLEEYRKMIIGTVREIGLDVVKQGAGYGQVSNKVKVIADLILPIPKNLKFGTEVEVNITTAEFKDIKVIPLEAVLGETGENFVFIIRDGVALKMNIEVGLNSMNKIEVRKGLNVGDMVVTRGNIDLAGGEKI